MMRTRSGLTASGMTATKRSPRRAHAMAKAIDVDPLDASTTAVRSSMSPPRIAWPRTWAARRSLVDPLGWRNSSFTQIVHPVASSSIGPVGVRTMRASRRAARWAREGAAAMTGSGYGRTLGAMAGPGDEDILEPILPKHPPYQRDDEVSDAAADAVAVAGASA